MKNVSRYIAIGMLISAGAVATAGQTPAAAGAAQPNIIIILTDDQGYQDLGCYGSPSIATPHLDRLAAEGMKFTDFYAASCVCSASRAALLTGCYPQRIGVRGVFWPNREGGLEPEHVTLAEMLKSVGYETAAVGKWHLGHDPQHLPTNQGFDSYYGIPYSNDMYPDRDMKYAAGCLFREGHSLHTLEEAFDGPLRKGNPLSMQDKVPLMRDAECIEFPADQTTITRRYTDEGIAFISESVKSKKPFFLYLAHTMPHVPLFVSPEFRAKSAGGLYGDVIEEIDCHTGRLLDHLEKLGIEKNTIVIFTSDNGPWLVKGDHAGSALPLFEGKMTHFEGGHRVPALIRWPAQVPAGSTCTEVTLSMDLLPTLADVAGAPLPENELDGRDVIDLWKAKAGAKSPHERVFFCRHAVRSGPWKYHREEVFKLKWTARDTEGPTLYNLEEDIGESNNLIGEYPDIAARLDKALSEHNTIPEVP